MEYDGYTMMEHMHKTQYRLRQHIWYTFCIHCSISFGKLYVRAMTLVPILSKYYLKCVVGVGAYINFLLIVAGDCHAHMHTQDASDLVRAMTHFCHQHCLSVFGSF